MPQVWNAEKALREWIVRNKPTGNLSPFSSQLPKIHFYEEMDHIPLDELEQAVIKAARIVKDLGTEYIDIFERAERELQNARQERNTLERIKRIATGYQSSNIKSNLFQPKSFLLKAWSRTVSGTNVFVPHKGGLHLIWRLNCR